MRTLPILLAILALGRLASAQESSTKPEKYELRPYAIRMVVDFEAGTRVDLARRNGVLEDWTHLVRRFVGDSWSAEIVDDAGSLLAFSIESLKADELKRFSEKADKVWAIRVRSNGPDLILEGKELDVTTKTLGEVHRRKVAFPSDLPRELFQLTRSMFAPSAEVGESKAGGVSFLVQGGSIPAASPGGDVAPVGSIFRVLRIFLNDDGSPKKIEEARHSYFRVERREGPFARCEIIKGVGDPLTSRYAAKNKIVALGIKPSSAPTRLRFKIKTDGQPAAGYKLVARPIPAGRKPTELGMTDREGRIELPVGFADGLVSLRLMAGNDEPMLDIPVMPGETLDDRPIVFVPRPLTLALEARLDALKDAIIDVVSLRTRIFSRMKARLDGEDWPALDAEIKEFRTLTPREQFEAKLDKIRGDGEDQEKETNSLVLTRNARAQLDEIRGLIDRYLDDDKIRSYEDAAQRAKAELAKPQAPAKKK